MMRSRRNFIATCAKGAAFFSLPPLVSLAAGTERGFRKETLDLARRHLISCGLPEKMVGRLLSDGRLAKAGNGRITLMAEKLRKMKYGEYKRAFDFEGLLDRGNAFLFVYGPELRRSEETTGVPIELVTALLGVESAYGKKTGVHVAVNVFLTQVENDNGKRGVALSNLSALIAVCRKFGRDPLSVKGSYAGAIGPMQFMPGTLLAHDFRGAASFEELVSIPMAIRLTSEKLARDGVGPEGDMLPGSKTFAAVWKYNPGDSKKYPALVCDLAMCLQAIRGIQEKRLRTFPDAAPLRPNIPARSPNEAAELMPTNSD